MSLSGRWGIISSPEHAANEDLIAFQNSLFHPFLKDPSLQIILANQEDYETSGESICVKIYSEGEKISEHIYELGQTFHYVYDSDDTVNLCILQDCDKDFECVTFLQLGPMTGQRRFDL